MDLGPPRIDKIEKKYKITGGTAQDLRASPPELTKLTKLQAEWEQDLVELGTPELTKLIKL